MFERIGIVTVSTRIAASPQEVWQTVMNPKRLGDWVTIHRRLLHADEGPPRIGFEMDQQIHLRGVSMEIHWKLVHCEPQQRAIWEGRGPARSRAHTEYVLHSDGDGTKFDYRNEFHPPLGPLGALAGRALVGGIPEREARHSLDRLRECLEC
jgi:carbon monoxide dehydrogenase subunit G